MIYIGYFSFDELGENGAVRHGYLSGIVASENQDLAIEAFKEAIEAFRERGSTFRRCRAVYIEDIIEMPKAPERALITRYQSSQGEFPKSMSYSLPLADASMAEAYGFAEDIDRTQGSSEEQYREAVPFMTF